MELEKISERALAMRPLRMLLAILAVPFYVAGYAAGFVWLGITWALAAVVIGCTDARARGADRTR